MRGNDLSSLEWQPANDPEGMAAYEAFDAKGAVTTWFATVITRT
ncbi:MAG TPA: hypothetical protein VGJ93_14855 [Desulfuromonadaceae bacterium]|jgi:hypothetical protein